jgi:hypothetical protein
MVFDEERLLPANFVDFHLLKHLLCDQGFLLLNGRHYNLLDDLGLSLALGAA